MSAAAGVAITSRPYEHLAVQSAVRDVQLTIVFAHIAMLSELRLHHSISAVRRERAIRHTASVAAGIQVSAEVAILAAFGHAIAADRCIAERTRCLAGVA
jgi:hypothetical protein